MLQADLQADCVPFSQKAEVIGDLPAKHPLRISAEIKAREPWLAEVLADFYAVRSHQAPRLEQSDEVRAAMSAFAAAYERYMVALQFELRRTGV